MFNLNKINIDILKKIKKNIYSKPHKSSYHHFNDNNNNCNNVLIDLLDDNKIDNAKNVMISELDIKLYNSPEDSTEEIKPFKKVMTTKNNESENEFKKELTDNIIRFLQKNKQNNNTLNEIKCCNLKNNIIEKSKRALNLTSLTPGNLGFKTINVNKNNEPKINNKNNYFIKIKRNLNSNKKTANVGKNNTKNEAMIKNLRNKKLKSYFVINSNTYKKIKKTNIIYNHPRDSLFSTGKKKSKNFRTFNDNKRINSSIKYNKNSSFLKEIINKSNTLRTSFQNSMIKNNFKRLNKHKIEISNSKPKEKSKENTKNIFIKTKSKHTLTENCYNSNTTKNITNRRYDINNFRNNFIKEKLILNKFINLKLKDLNLNSNNLMYPRKSYNSFINNTFNTEKDRNYSTIICEKKKLKSPLNKKLKIQVKKNYKTFLNKNPINIVNININKNNNFIMNINNENCFNSHKFNNSSSKMEGKIRKFFSFQNFLNLSENYKKNILKRNVKEKNINKNMKIV